MALVAAHRGIVGGHFRHRIRQNSLASIEEAIRRGADMVEFDVRRTLDGEFVLIHDERYRGIPVGRMTYADLCRRIRRQGVLWPRLEDVVQQCAGRIRLDIELKEPGGEREIGELCLRHISPDRFVVTSFRDDVIAAMKRAHPAIRCGLLLGSARPTARSQLQELFPFARVERCGADLIVPHASLAPLLLRRAAERGVGVMVWTMGVEQRLPRFIEDPRVEAVITNNVDEALAARRGVGGLAIGA